MDASLGAEKREEEGERGGREIKGEGEEDKRDRKEDRGHVVFLFHAATHTPLKLVYVTEASYTA